MHKALGFFLLIFTVQCKHVAEPAKPKATPVDRKVIGAGQAYHGLRSLDTKRLTESMEYRRAKAWELVQSLVREVPIAQGEDLGGFQPLGGRSLPLWQTWYDQAEFREIFTAAYGTLEPGERLAGNDLCPDTLEAALRNHANKKLHIRYRGDRFEQRLKQFENVQQVRGISGRGITLFSPALILHYLMNYQRVGQCRQLRAAYSRETPPNTADNFAPCLKAEFPGPDSWTQNVEKLDFSHCHDQRMQPEELSSKLRDEAGVAVAIKTSWVRVGPGQSIGHFHFDPVSVSQAFAKGEWLPSSSTQTEELSPEQIYTIETIPDAPSDPRQRYQLAALHIVSKDTRDWLWVSLIWSPDPGTDFGADRPDTLQNMQPWNNYKMCVTAAYDEKDSGLDQAFSQQHPDLNASLRQVQSFVGLRTYCSNPFIERGLGNSRSNCIGCHQHAHTGIGQDEIFLDDPSDPNNAARRLKYPESSRAKVRNNFPSDYLWSFFEDDIAAILASFKQQDAASLH